jgi:hypothetical protein
MLSMLSMNLLPHPKVSMTQLALEVIPHGTNTDRTRWVSVGRILHRTYGQAGLPLFKTWSYSGDYKPADGDEELQRVWDSFETDLLASSAKKITIRSLYGWADEADPERRWRDRWRESQFETLLRRSAGAGSGGNDGNDGNGDTGPASQNAGPLPNLLETESTR